MRLVMIRSIEDLNVWQEARLLNKKIYQLTANFPITEKNNLVSQLRRASSSICANIAEGFGRFNLQESMQFYRIARGSLIEIKSHLYLASDQLYFKEDLLKELLSDLDKIGKMLNAFINKTKEYRISKLSSKL